MAREIAAAVDAKRHLVVQAGTGTGKTLAYLVPLILSGARVVVSTATTALQDQLGGKDLPFLAEHMDQLGTPVTFAVVKGRSNYLCKQKAVEVAGGANTLDLDPDELSGLGREVALLLAWAAESETGDRAELDFEPRPKAWSQVSLPATECPGAAKCPIGDDCFAEQARQRAAEADVIVVNTALYGMHLASGRHLLPEHDVVVFDEAHELEDVAATSLGLEMTGGRLEAAARLSAGLLSDRDLAERVSELGPILDDTLRKLDGERVDPGENEMLAAVLGLADKRVRELAAAVRKVEPAADGVGRKARAQQALGHLAGDLAYLTSLPASHVAWVEQKRILKVAAVAVGDVLAENLWGEVTAVLTSATIPPFVVGRLGLPVETTEVIDVGSPFDHREQGMLYVPRHLPDPTRPGGDEAMIAELEWLIGAAGGRTLALFTSYRRMQAAADALR